MPSEEYLRAHQALVDGAEREPAALALLMAAARISTRDRTLAAAAVRVPIVLVPSSYRRALLTAHPLEAQIWRFWVFYYIIFVILFFS